MTEQPKSECKCLDCNLPELETLSYKPTIAELEKAIGTPDEMDIFPNGDVRPKYPNICSKQPTKPSPATKENLTPIIESKTKVENSKVVGQPLEQPNTELLIVKTIQGLTTCINNELEKLVVLTACMPEDERKALIRQALEDINSFEKTTLFELQKAFE